MILTIPAQDPRGCQVRLYNAAKPCNRPVEKNGACRNCYAKVTWLLFQEMPEAFDVHVAR